MIRTLAITNDSQILQNVPLEQLSDPHIKWFLVDFNMPSEKEGLMLDKHFHFHPLAIEDCFHLLERPKLDYYEAYNFFVFHVLNQKTLDPEEIDMFVGKDYIVTFHMKELKEVDIVWERLLTDKNLWDKGKTHVFYMLMDKLVDEYFPALYQIEDRLNKTEGKSIDKSIRWLIDEVFDIRGDLLKLRRIIVPMRDLLYRILNSEHLDINEDQKVYFTDIYDHLLKLTEMIDSNRDITADMRDSYLSLNSNRMNTIMMTLTIISSIFIPLTFIAGVYGMNFENMPELKWRYGYFIVVGFMAALGIGMVLWFKHKGWFDK
ncbi:magnesium transporter [Scopulibacillus darangshiensis]|uniref:Magnesium transport protein CorA n=1 Tax=Scopulibacillus darangshiensis TaxID=442528 RepID=A0A4R2NE90_9BACL|nr:magnesium/cobalt transporter CorA [Scopulibacillus darangshiensis]TCP19500.1 magnesium transporter [Scopulibacillus darangshiensis]